MSVLCVHAALTDAAVWARWLLALGQLAPTVLTDPTLDEVRPGFQPKERRLTLSAMPTPVINPDTREQTDLNTPWTVVMHNDPINLFAMVVKVLQKVCEHPKEKAERLTNQIHNEGKAVVWDGPKEQAEMKAHQLQGWGLDARMEKA